MATLSDETCFGDLFKRFAPFLKMYVEYCTQHENTASRVSLIAAKNDKFGNLLHVSTSRLVPYRTMLIEGWLIERRLIDRDG